MSNARTPNLNAEHWFAAWSLFDAPLEVSERIAARLRSHHTTCVQTQQYRNYADYDKDRAGLGSLQMVPGE